MNHNSKFASCDTSHQEAMNVDDLNFTNALHEVLRGLQDGGEWCRLRHGPFRVAEESKANELPGFVGGGNTKDCFY